MTAVIFDLDGTLVESAPVIRDVANRLMAEIDLPQLELADVHKFVGEGTPVFLERALKKFEVAYSDAEFDAWHTRLKALHSEAPGAASLAMPGVDDALAVLHRRGDTLGVCTNKPEAATHNVLKARGWDRLLSAVIAGDTLAQRKPDPEPLLETARRMKATPVVFVGDSETDAATAEAAGVPFLLYTKGYRKSDTSELVHAAAFSDFAELPGLVERIGGKA